MNEIIKIIMIGQIITKIGILEVEIEFRDWKI